MLEMIYVARSCGLTDAMLPLALVDQTIQMTYKTCACNASCCVLRSARLAGGAYILAGWIDCARIGADSTCRRARSHALAQL